MRTEGPGNLAQRKCLPQNDTEVHPQPCPKLYQNKVYAIIEAQIQDFRNTVRSYRNLADCLTFLHVYLPN